MSQLLSLDEILFQEEPHAYLYRGKAFRSVTDRLKDSGICEDFSAVPEARMEFARRRGSMVHLACQYMDEKRLNPETVDERIRGYVEAYAKFLLECRIKVVAVEKKLISTHLDVAGRPDLVCFVRGRRSIVDRKTGQVFGKSTGPQTAGYKILWDASHPKQPIQDRYGLRLEAKGKYKLIALDDPLDTQAFLDAVKFSKANDRMNYWRNHYGYSNHAASRRAADDCSRVVG